MIYCGKPGPFAESVEESVMATVYKVLNGASATFNVPVPSPGSINSSFVANEIYWAKNLEPETGVEAAAPSSPW